MGLPSLTAHPGATAPRKQEADTSRPRCAECQGAERGSFLPSKTSGWSHCSPVWPGCPCCKKTDCVLQQPYKARITTACSETFPKVRTCHEATGHKWEFFNLCIRSHSKKWMFLFPYEVTLYVFFFKYRKPRQSACKKSWHSSRIPRFSFWIHN